MKHPAVKFILTLLISAGALYLAFHGQNFGELWLALKTTNIWWILGGVFMMFLSHLCRAWRWQIILKPMKQETSLWVSYRSIIAGYGMNNIVPRSAELIRPFIFAKHEKVYVSGAVASILVERVTDLVSMVLFLMVSLVLFPRELSHAFPNIASATVPLMAGMAVLLALVIIMIFSANKTIQVIFKITRRLPVKVRNSIDRASTEFANGLRGVRQSGAIPIVIGTIGIWVFYVLSMYVSLQAFKESQILAVGMIGAFFLRVLSGLAFLIPTPGGMGSYHYFISQALIKIFSVPAPIALVYATITHAANYLITTIAGLVIVLFEGASFKEIAKVLKAAEVHRPDTLVATAQQFEVPQDMKGEQEMKGKNDKSTIELKPQPSSIAQ